MELPVQLTFRDVEPSAAIEAAVHERAQKLNRFHPRITGCRVLFASPDRLHHKKPLYHVRIDVTVPGGEIVVNKDLREQTSKLDAYLAIREAFSTAERRLSDFARRQRGDVKQHRPPRAFAAEPATA